jgi:hypothetical protein
MIDINRRIERMERILAAEDCVCDIAEDRSVMVCPDGWTKEQRDAAEASAGVVCPVHGFSRKRILWISEADAKL